MTKPKALDLAGWRRTQTEPDPKGGMRQLTQREFARRIGIAHETLCRIERGRIWPSPHTWASILAVMGIYTPDGVRAHRVKDAQRIISAAYSPDRKGKRP